MLLTAKRFLEYQESEIDIMPIPSNNSDLSILIIDDDELILDSLSELLEANGYQIHTAKGSAQGIAKISNGIRANIIIADYRMRNQNGVETVKSIRQLLGEKVAAIIFTDDTTDEARDVARQNKCIVLRKPHDVETLANKISRMSA